MPNGDFARAEVADAAERWRANKATPEDKLLVTLADYLERQSKAIEGLTACLQKSLPVPPPDPRMQAVKRVGIPAVAGGGWIAFLVSIIKELLQR